MFSEDQNGRWVESGSYGRTQQHWAEQPDPDGLSKDKQNFYGPPENRDLKWDSEHNNGEGMTNAKVGKVMCLAGHGPVLIGLGNERVVSVEMLVS